MNVPWYQRVFTNFIWIFSGFFFLSSFLDTINNNITLVTPFITFIGTFLTIAIFLGISIVLRKAPVLWRTNEGDNVHVKSLGPKPILVFIGILIALWMPRLSNTTYDRKNDLDMLAATIVAIEKNRESLAVTASAIETKQVVLEASNLKANATKTVLANELENLKATREVIATQVAVQIATSTALARSFADPVLYDNFDNPLYEGSYNLGLWSKMSENLFDVKQQDGALAFTNPSSAKAGDFVLELRQPPKRYLKQLSFFEARLKLSNNHKGDLAFVKIQISTEVQNHTWWTQCRLEIWQKDGKPDFVCDVYTFAADIFTEEYVTDSVSVEFDRWYKARIEIDPITAALSFYIDENLIGRYLPKDSTNLINSKFTAKVGMWNRDDNTSVSRYIDDVRITP